MAVRLRWFKRWRPRSLQARQLLAASVSLVAFLALAGYALDAAFADTAMDNLRSRLKNYATAYNGSIDFLRDGSLYIREQSPDARFDVPGGGLYAEVIRPDERWSSMSAEGPVLPVSGPMLGPRQEEFTGPLDMVQIDGTKGQVFRYGQGVIYETEPGHEIPYTIYVMEDARSLGAQLRVFRSAVWFYLGITGIFLLLLQTFILQWSLRPLRRVVNELTKVQRGEAQRMSEHHPRELEPLTDSINAFIESERENLDRQRNTLADLAHSLKTPLAVLRTQLDTGGHLSEGELRDELDVQLRRMNNLVSYQLARAASSGHKLFAAPVPIETNAEEIVRGLEKVYAAKGVLCEFEIDPNARFYGEPGDLQELLGNLLENAFKWARSRVLLTAKPMAGVGSKRAGLMLAVDDDGPGIAPEDVAKILQRGVRGDERVQGHGIGLSIVQDLVRGYRGELHVTRSNELSGARFEVTLPPGL